MPDLGQSETSRYIVICRRARAIVVRVVGPFDTQDEAITWAHEHRRLNHDWLFTPDVIEPPDREMSL